MDMVMKNKEIYIWFHIGYQKMVWVLSVQWNIYHEIYPHFILIESMHTNSVYSNVESWKRLLKAEKDCWISKNVCTFNYNHFEISGTSPKTLLQESEYKIFSWDSLMKYTCSKKSHAFHQMSLNVHEAQGKTHFSKPFLRLHKFFNQKSGPA